eukprot:GHVN01100612.1.p1 GENE.GHVN01100612.1~~GHVN01100612.1.p1  ORF type:complete len:133 (-),score=27.36 GHVN01100612.1:203-601(-)
MDQCEGSVGSHRSHLTDLTTFSDLTLLTSLFLPEYPPTRAIFCASSCSDVMPTLHDIVWLISSLPSHCLLSLSPQSHRLTDFSCTFSRLLESLRLTRFPFRRQTGISFDESIALCDPFPAQRVNLKLFHSLM